MKKELLKIKLTICLVMILSIGSCQNKNIEYSEFFKLSSSHEFKSKKVIDYMSSYMKQNADYKDYNINTGIIAVIKNNENYKFCITLVEYKKFKKYRSKSTAEFKGYTKFKNLPILLYGDIEPFFKIKKGVTINKELLGDFPVFDKNNPPIIYEPNYDCIEW